MKREKKVKEPKAPKSDKKTRRPKRKGSRTYDRPADWPKPMHMSEFRRTHRSRPKDWTGIHKKPAKVEEPVGLADAATK